MAYFEWGPDLVVDNGVIDAEHMRLVDLVNELHTATSEGRGQEVVGRIMKELIEYTVYHFRNEEGLMSSLRFPGLAPHKLGHDQFIDELRKLQEKYEAGSITVASQLSTVLRDWLSLHIRREDKEIVRFTKKAAVPGNSRR
jgi:hemerythrin-like metal-binding protein